MRLLLLISLIILGGCAYNFEPSTTSVEYGTTENGKNKTQKNIKQTFKWDKKK